jgi:glycosyltransferase involved in cell wall biosynthesis
MRIALVGARSHPAQHGGIERAVESLAAEYARLGHDVQVLVADSGDGSAGAQGSVQVREVAAAPGKYTKALTQALASVPPLSRRTTDVVHVHGVGPGMVVPLLRARRLPTVLTVHALDFDRDKWPKPARALFKALSRPGVRTADGLIAVAGHLADDVERAFGRRPDVLANGIAVPEPDLALLDRHGVTQGSYLLFVGRLVPEKRVDVLLRAHAAAGGDVPLLVVGSGTGSYAGDHEKLLRELAGPGTRMLGELPHDEVCALVAGAIALVNPSRLEGMPLTVLEAQALGTPVVLSDIAPHREIAGAATSLVPADDVAALAEELARAVQEREQRGSAAREDRDRVRREHSWASVAEQHLERYAAAIAAR